MESTTSILLFHLRRLFACFSRLGWCDRLSAVFTLIACECHGATENFAASNGREVCRRCHIGVHWRLFVFAKVQVDGGDAGGGCRCLRLPVSTVFTSSEVALVPVDCVDAGSEWSSCRKVAIGGESSQKNNLKTEMGFLVLIAGNSYWEIKVIAFSVEGRPISI